MNPGEPHVKRLHSPLGVTAIVFGGLAALLALVAMKPLGVALPHTLLAGSWWLIPLGGTALISGSGALKTLGLTNFDRRGVMVAVAGSLFMAAGMLLDGGSMDLNLHRSWNAALRPGLVEELVFRGFAFGLLYWRAGWSFVAAMLTTGVIFGAFHLPGTWLTGNLDQAWGTMLLTGAGGCWFSWIYVRWGRSLWVPIAAHTSMNLWWVLFQEGPTAVGGGSGAMWGRVVTITAVTIATSKMAPAHKNSDPSG